MRERENEGVQKKFAERELYSLLVVRVGRMKPAGFDSGDRHPNVGFDLPLDNEHIVAVYDMRQGWRSALAHAPRKNS